VTLHLHATIANHKLKGNMMPPTSFFCCWFAIRNMHTHTNNKNNNKTKNKKQKKKNGREVYLSQ
jgi:hypothetical protein